MYHCYFIAIANKENLMHYKFCISFIILALQEPNINHINMINLMKTKTWAAKTVLEVLPIHNNFNNEMKENWVPSKSQMKNCNCQHWNLFQPALDFLSALHKEVWFIVFLPSSWKYSWLVVIKHQQTPSHYIHPHRSIYCEAVIKKNPNIYFIKRSLQWNFRSGKNRIIVVAVKKNKIIPITPVWDFPLRHITHWCARLLMLMIVIE